MKNSSEARSMERPVPLTHVFIDIANNKTTNSLTKRVRDGEFTLGDLILARHFKEDNYQHSLFLDRKIKLGTSPSYIRLRELAKYFQ